MWSAENGDTSTSTMQVRITPPPAAGQQPTHSLKTVSQSDLLRQRQRQQQVKWLHYKMTQATGQRSQVTGHTHQKRISRQLYYKAHWSLRGEWRPDQHSGMTEAGWTYLLAQMLIQSYRSSCNNWPMCYDTTIVSIIIALWQWACSYDKWGRYVSRLLVFGLVLSGYKSVTNSKCSSWEAIH